MKKIATLALLAGTFAFAQTPAPTQETAPRKSQHADRMMAGLNLTESQKQQATTLFQESRKSSEPIRQQLKQNREALSAAMKANDAAKIQQLSSEQGNLRGQLLTIRADTHTKFLAMLTPEQRVKAEAARERMKQRMRSRQVD